MVMFVGVLIDLEVAVNRGKTALDGFGSLNAWTLYLVFMTSSSH
jgi:hypothetical protein